MFNVIKSLLMVLVGVYCLNAQSKPQDGLHLTGSLLGLNAVAECGGTDGRLLIQISLSMQFRNSSDRALIVFKPEFFNTFRSPQKLGDTQTLFLRSLSSHPDEISESTVARHIVTDDCRPTDRFYNRDFDFVADFIRRTSPYAPPASLFAVIEPGSYYQFREFITVDTGYDISVKLGNSLKEARIRSSFPAFRVRYRLSVKSDAKGGGYLESLRSKWKDYGDLVLNENGDFTATSSPITNIEMN